MLEGVVEQPDHGIFGVTIQRFLATCPDEVTDLRETLNDVTCLTPLLEDRCRPSRAVFETVFVVEQTELSHGAVVDDAAVDQAVVTVPVEPAEDVVGLEARRGTTEVLGDLFGQPRVALGSALTREFAVAHLAGDVGVGHAA